MYFICIDGQAACILAKYQLLQVAQIEKHFSNIQNDSFDDRVSEFKTKLNKAQH